MTNEVVQYSVPDIERMATAIAKSQLFGVKTPEQAIALCLVAQAEGKHPALAARDYDIIQGRPAKKPEAMLRDFIAQGGKVEWHEMSDTKADASFSHAQGGKVRVVWDMERAKTAGLAGKDNWKKWPRQMLRSRVTSEGIRTVFPSATSGMYVPEEVQDFDDKPMVDVTPKSIFKNAALRNKVFDNIVKSFDEAKSIDDLKKLAELNKQQLDDMAASGNEHDALAVEEIRKRYALVRSRFEKPVKQDIAASYGEGFAEIRDYEEDDDEPASIKATSLPEGQAMPSFMAKGR